MTTHDADDGINDARLAAIVDSSFDAIVGKDLNGIINFWNRAAERLFGYSTEEAVGQSVLMLIPEPLRDEETEILARLRRGERVESFETIRRRRDGQLIDVSLTISPIRDRTGRIVGASKIARDISRNKESERRIRMLMREVNHRVKNQYAVILSIIRETSKRARNREDFEHQVRERIMGLSRSHDLLVSGDWRGASLSELGRHQLALHGQESRVSFEGPEVTLLPAAVQNIGMAFQELATNSARFGVMSRGKGSIAVRWDVKASTDDAEPMLRLTWTESIPYAPAAEPDATIHEGFGTVVLRRVAPFALNGASELSIEPDGVRWSLTAPASSAIAGYPDSEDGA